MNALKFKEYQALKAMVLKVWGGCGRATRQRTIASDAVAGAAHKKSLRMLRRLVRKVRRMGSG